MIDQLSLLFAQAEPAPGGMTTEAWTFLLVVWGVILANVGYCFWKLLTSERRLDGED
jgi:hypothetical protein